MTSLTINKILTIESNPTNTLLESMENAGLLPEYNCRDGHCGACRCRLISGEVEYVGFAMAYTQGNEILPCICKAKSALELEDVKYFPKAKRA
ncbi:2Fe-2S iron-sulfur cluster binding domain-containing protein [Vibrio sp. V27_P1S3P104]|uniref:class I ribonucleotide reductase maintenance protein YfaE n=1 Tax=Vibrio TaxID=662 RepID=UPI000C1705FB|nr:MULTISPECIES: class I ribonucleotide reductase maintenance protein YfaE [Vibrio]NAW68603.1 2Fe-2S iron-sulfur cluster binding domain-containing protein [Vibrio sp. V28_P6S34P95]NAX04505.1 2Fe-2S iron-sulfur cluster binding domain-containing protein [Vibrio sp. V30_P3S12P165]NAX33029.1 2Fe-2S iron-sulfur cluster binding domain-containing protein [Vibrio sp. V29_P1S30P107]NAX36758.1 2Fe-2S iron-sulfur cluster binding domain-containing protein [Vibrio sp. V27_P1S3P104]NNN45125.1 2Fe-2S iron-su